MSDQHPVQEAEYGRRPVSLLVLPAAPARATPPCPLTAAPGRPGSGLPVGGVAQDVCLRVLAASGVRFALAVGHSLSFCVALSCGVEHGLFMSPLSVGSGLWAASVSGAADRPAANLPARGHTRWSPGRPAGRCVQAWRCGQCPAVVCPLFPLGAFVLRDDQAIITLSASSNIFFQHLVIISQPLKLGYKLPSVS